MADVAELVTASREFVSAEVLPLDGEHDGDIEAAGGEELRQRLQARAAGLLALQGPVDCGGLGLNMSGILASMSPPSRYHPSRVRTAKA